MYDINFNFNPLGAAGMAGAVVYAALTFLISPKATLLIQVFMPLVMLATYFFILGNPARFYHHRVEMLLLQCHQVFRQEDTREMKSFI